MAERTILRPRWPLQWCAPSFRRSKVPAGTTTSPTEPGLYIFGHNTTQNTAPKPTTTSPPSISGVMTRPSSVPQSRSVTTSLGRRPPDDGSDNLSSLSSGSVRQTFTRTVGGGEVLEYVHLHGSWPRWGFDNGAVWLGHQTTHTRQLTDLSRATTAPESAIM